jgi:hypothetical protein
MIIDYKMVKPFLSKNVTIYGYWLALYIEMKQELRSQSF